MTNDAKATWFPLFEFQDWIYQSFLLLPTYAEEDAPAGAPVTAKKWARGSLVCGQAMGDAGTGYFKTPEDKAIPALRPGFDRSPPQANPIAGPVWVEGLMTVRDPQDRERLVATYTRVKDLATVVERGVAVFDDEAKEFRILTQFAGKRGHRSTQGSGRARQLSWRLALVFAERRRGDQRRPRAPSAFRI